METNVLMKQTVHRNQIHTFFPPATNDSIKLVKNIIAHSIAKTQMNCGRSKQTENETE